MNSRIVEVIWDLRDISHDDVKEGITLYADTIDKLVLTQFVEIPADLHGDKIINYLYEKHGRNIYDIYVDEE